jgi:hypothetical protein
MILNPQAYNAAIALNNAGALLIQRRMPFEAVATIQAQVPEISEDQSSHCSLEKQIFIVTDHENPFTVHDTLRRTPNSLCAIKIDPLECLIEREDIMDRLEIESSIMLYNYAIASTCSA